ncbi:MAG: hypothetical protein AAF226_05475, partial [Verrucomicrobiota bacterium]
TNILVITYEMTIGDNFQALDEVTNAATITEYYSQDDTNAGRQNQALTDTTAISDQAIVEGRTISIEKVIYDTSLDHTGTEFDDEDVAFSDATLSTLVGAVIDVSTLDSFPANAALEVGTVEVDLNGAIFGEVGTGALIQENQTPTLVSTDTGAGTITITGGDDIVSGDLVVDGEDYTFDNGTIKDSTGTIVGSYVNGADDETVINLLPGSFTTVGTISFDREVADIDYNAGTITFTENVATAPNGGYTPSVSYTRTFGDAGTTDLTPGETVYYDISVTMPEGVVGTALNGLLITDHLPDGLEVTGLEIIILAFGFSGCFICFVRRSFSDCCYIVG